MNPKLLRAKDLCNSEPDEALRLCNDVLNDDFDGIDGQMALFMSGYIMMEAERYGLAYNIYKRCAELSPNRSEIYSNMGMCAEEWSPEEAIKCFQKAQKLDPDNGSAYANEGLMWLQMGNPNKCIRLSEKACEKDPDLISPIHNKGLAKIMLKQWSEGWTDYANTLGVKHRERRDYGVPDWDLKSPGRILLYGEQGVGDEIMFASCIPDLIRDGYDLILDTDSRLKNLFQRSFPQVKVYGTRFCNESPLVDEEHYDYQCAIGQLPFRYRFQDDMFPGTPYLCPDYERVLQWKALFYTFSGRKIGISWSGGLKNTGKSKRSFDLDDYGKLISLNDGDTFISLEYNHPDQEELDRYGVKHYQRATGKGQDIDDLAAIVANLDFVITACTTVVYVAGALGIPCFVLTPNCPGYRYHMDGSEFPWYKSVELIRQKKNQPWKKVIDRLIWRLKNAENIHRLRSDGDRSLPCVLP